ncbi:hypothetical protein OV203_26045 [Nannocystis sp. ILAH1]|uniref:hypothetical protein n=1 Tax=Nannocystis sp. ILAH1 TaxID=2996789 RepID=UPI00227117DE|nr:hypothetical protein [Nannocystis sp. ILAH1]MCY0990632.1 hypothetical protein [Nannocystis sp. ILAH1]
MAAPQQQAQYKTFNVTALPKIVPVVLPPSADPTLSGRIRNVPVRGSDNSGWLMEAGARGWVLKPEKVYDGFALLEDLYGAEGNTEGWEQYKRYIRDWQAGKTTRPFPHHLLPVEVQKRQRGEIAAEYADPWNLPSPPPTTGAVSEPKGKGK